MNFNQNRLHSALIRKRRKELKWKQESLIMSIPISLSYYSEIERGLRKIPEDLLAKLYSKLNLPYLSEDWYLIYIKKI